MARLAIGEISPHDLTANWRGLEAQTHPTRKRNRTRGLSGLVREPFAMGIALTENPNRGLRRAAPLNYSQRNHESLGKFLRRIDR